MTNLYCVEAARIKTLKPLAMGVFALCVGGVLVASGCSEEEPVAVVQAPPPAPPAPPPPPPVASIEQLMAELNIDPRVNLPEAKAPATTEDRKAVLEFFDAFARGNGASLKGMLTGADQRELDALMATPAWKQTTSQITSIDIQTGADPAGEKCALAVIEVGTGGATSFQPQLWLYKTDAEEPVFEAVASPPGILDKLSGDWIATWFQILAAELALADQPDEEFAVAQVDVNSDAETSDAQKPPKGGLRAPEGPRDAPRGPSLPGAPR